MKINSILILLFCLLLNSLSHADTLLSDDFDPDYDPTVWESFGGFVEANTHGQAAGPGSTGNSLWFGGSGSRFATTIPVNTLGGGDVSFLFALSDGPSFPWENADPGEEVVLEYSLDGIDFVLFGGPYSNRTWQQITETIPQEAQSAVTRFRFRQLAHSGSPYDHWAIDDFSVKGEDIPNTGLWAMGGNDSGQLGDGYATSQTTPIQVGSEVMQVSAGASHSMFLKANGTLWAMGLNNSGQLGDGTLLAQPLPVLVATEVASVSAGGSCTMFVKSDGTLWGIGANNFGQLGDGSTTPRTSPVQVATGVASVSTDGLHTLFVKTNGSLWGMGYNDRGQLGDGTLVNRSLPVQITTGVSSAFAGTFHSLFIRTNGTLWAMGDNNSGQLGDGSRINRASPVQITTNVVAASAGSLHSLFIKSDGSLWATGSNSHGQLGNNSGGGSFRTSPIQVTTDVADVSAGSRHSLFIKADGSLWGMGRNLEGQLGDGSTTGRFLPVPITTDVVDISAGSSHSLYLGPDIATPVIDAPVIITSPADVTIVPGGTVTLSMTVSGPGIRYRWYEGSPGDTTHLVSNTLTPSYTTPALYAPTSYWVRASNTAGEVDSTSISVILEPPPPLGPGLWAAGRNHEGQLGDGSITDRISPVLVSSDKIASIAAGGAHSLLLKADRGLWAMGHNVNGQLGDGSTTRRRSPVSIATDVTAIACGFSHSLFLKTDGSLWAMGNNAQGQLGDGTTTNRILPVQIATSVSAISAGALHSLFVKSDGTLWTMGYNWYGQLGDGSKTNRTSPVQIATDVLAIAAGGVHSLFMKSDGTLWAMGRNSDGQLGNGSLTDRSSPISVANGVSAIAAGYSHSFFLKADGSLWAMGQNSSGQLGDGSTTRRNSPVAIATDVTMIASGNSHSLFLKTDNSLWAMGQNSNGQLGDGTTIQRNSPIHVASGIDSFTAGTGFSFFLTEMPPIALIRVEAPSGTPVSSSSSVLAFGHAAPQSTRERIISIRSDGDADLTGILATISGPDMSEFELLSLPASFLAAGTTTEFIVSFSPIADGVKTATLSIISNDIENSPFTITLSGSSGTAPSFEDLAATAGLTGYDALPNAIPFNDGVENLLKYAFNMNLAGPDSSTLTPGGAAGLPVAGLDESGTDPVWRLKYVRRKDSGLIYTPEKSTTLAADSFSPMTGTMTVDDIDAEWERVVITEPYDPIANPNYFSRLKVEITGD